MSAFTVTLTCHKVCNPEIQPKIPARPPLHKSKADERAREDATVDEGEASATHHWIHSGIPEGESE